MTRLLFALSVLAAGCTFASSAPATAAAAARNYDCSKPGNAKKAACKSAAAKPAKAAPAVKAKEAKASAPKATKTVEAAKPAAKLPLKQAANDRHYDCSKAGNANKAACKGSSAAKATVAAKTAPVGQPAAMPKAAPKAAPASTSAENNVAAGATAQCKDGTYSHAKNHRGACSRHGGVGKWLS